MIPINNPKMEDQMKSKLFILTIGLFAFVFSSVQAEEELAHYKRREERAFQVQALVGPNVGGVFQPGLSIGYHLSDIIYIGVQGQAARSERDSDNDGDRHDEYVYNQRHVEEQEVEGGSKIAAEIRFTPWEYGFYFSAGYLQNEESKISTTFENRLRIVGDNAYTTGLETEVTHKAWSGAAVGLGYNHIFTNGISLGIGGLFGLTDNQETEVEVAAVGGDTVSDSDLQKFKDDVEEESEGNQFIVGISLGYNF